MKKSENQSWVLNDVEIWAVLLFITGWHSRFCLIHSPGFLEFWNIRGMNRHDTPDDSVLTRRGIELPLCSTAECGDSEFCRVTLGKLWLSSYSGISWSLLDSLWKWSEGSTRDFQSAIAPPTLAAGQLLGSSRLITKPRTHAERLSWGRGDIFFWSTVNVESALWKFRLSKEARRDNAQCTFNICWSLSFIPLELKTSKCGGRVDGLRRK